MASGPRLHGKPVPECQTAVAVAAARGDEGDGGSIWNSKTCRQSDNVLNVHS